MTNIPPSQSSNLINLKKIKPSVLLALISLLIGRLILQQNLFRNGFKSLTADDFGRTLLSAHWAKDPQLIWDGFWLPFHLYLHGIALKINWEMYYTPRLINIIIGLLAIILVYYLTLELFHNHLAAFISALLLTINPVHLWLSSTTLAELPQSTLAFGSALSFILYLNGRSVRYLYLSALCLLIGNGFRYESWMISIVFSLYLGINILIQIWRRNINIQQLSHQVTAAVLPWLFPLAWMIGNKITNDDFLFFLTKTRDYKLQWYGEPESSYANFWPWLKTIDPFTTITIVFVLLIIFWLYRKSQTVRWYTLIALAPFLIFAYLHGGQKDQPGNYLRYLAPFVIMFYPFMAYAITKGVSKIISNRFGQLITIGLILSLITIIQLTTTYKVTQALKGFEVGEQIRSLRAEEDISAEQPVLIELVYWEYLAIHVGANDISPLILYDRPYDSDRQSTSFLLSDSDTIRSCLTQNNISYMLLKSENLIQLAEETLGLQPLEQIDGYRFYKIPSDFETGSTTPCPFVLDTY